ncbi:piggyBac transposable element-derived protein 4-like [Osmia bicornis bicornis]|uniref:piggyBac transposable element-derived protein 4-like n=1 Tax=Osmia bicornis bicornis TaxID=1437191 RepID=UPI001EAEBB3C|nr:piggyBac transposable element-derived protein 4-like [Osmia bicornis bicornis]
MNNPGPSSSTGHLHVHQDEEAGDFLSKSNQKRRKITTEDSDDSDIEYQDSVNMHYDEFDRDNSEVTFDESDNESDIDLESEDLNELFEDVDDAGEWTCDGDFKRFSFDGKSGLQGSPSGADPYNFFEFLFDNYFFSTIVMETNRYAEVKTNNQWKELTVAECRTFLGLLLHMGTIKCPKLQNYWSIHRLFGFHCFSQHMSRNRFHDILRSLHFSSMNGSNNRLNKIQPFIDYFNDKMKQVYYPYKELAINEILIPGRDRSAFRRYIAEKKYRHGVKLYVLTESSGMAVRIEASTGSEDDAPAKGHVTRVALRLMEDFLQKGHSLYTDHFCTSFTLSKQLLEAKTYFTGILRGLRKANGEDVIKTRLVKGEVISRRKDNIMIGKFRDEKEVLFLSSEFTADMIEFENKRKEKFKKPLALHKYNELMNNIAKRNQMLSCYTCSRRTFKWYIQLWINTIEMLLLNSFFLYYKYSPLSTKLNFHDFRLNIIDALLFENHRENVHLPFRESEHLPEMLPRGINNKVRRKRCRQCFASCVRKETNYFCSGCKDNPGLCLGKCFREYHKRI